MCWIGRPGDWPGFISCGGPGQNSELQGDSQGTVGKCPLVQKGIFQGCVGERHFPSPSGNSFFDWLLILSLLGAVCSLEWKSPLQADMGCVPRQIRWE